MSDEVQFVPGLIVKAPHERAPDFVKAKISIKISELKEFLEQQQGEWLNADVKVSRAGNWYCSIDKWEPDAQKKQYDAGIAGAKKAAEPAPDFDDTDSIPF